MAVLVIVLPLILIGFILFQQASDLYVALSTGNGALLIQFNAALEHARTILHVPTDFEFNINQYLRQGAALAVQNLGAIFSSIAQIALSIFVFVISFYFLLKDGARLKQYVTELSPLSDKDDELISMRLASAVRAVVVGNLTISVIQGTVSGIGYTIFGLPHAALWGGITAVAALVPGAGTSLIVVPAVLYLFFTNDTVSAIGLAAWGFAAVGLIDNLLGPRLVGRGMKLHPLLVMLSVLGGLGLFGPLGFLLGPLAMSLCLAFLDIYFSLRTKKNV
jgi:predicted PurR-regulated permease PerM